MNTRSLIYLFLFVFLSTFQGISTRNIFPDVRFSSIKASKSTVDCQRSLAKAGKYLDQVNVLLNTSISKSIQLPKLNGLIVKANSDLTEAKCNLQRSEFKATLVRVRNLFRKLQGIKKVVNWNEINNALNLVKSTGKVLTLMINCPRATSGPPSTLPSNPLLTNSPPPSSDPPLVFQIPSPIPSPSPPSNPPPSSPLLSSPPNPPPSIPPLSSPPNPPPSSPPPSSPPPPPLASPPKSPPGQTLNTLNPTNVTNYADYGLLPYGSGDAWSGPIHATWYGNDSGNNTYGACYGPLEKASEILGVYTAAGSKVLLQGGAECGACYQISCADARLCTSTSPVTVRLTNACPKSTGTGYPWCDFPRIHFDMSKPAFASMVDLKVGAVSINYRRVDCPVIQDIAFHIRNESNQWWFAITLLNVGGPGSVSGMWIKGSLMADWVPVYRSWGANWSIHRRPELLKQSVSFKLRGAGTNQYVVAQDVLPLNWAIGETYSGSQWDVATNEVIAPASAPVPDPGPDF